MGTTTTRIAIAATTAALLAGLIALDRRTGTSQARVAPTPAPVAARQEGLDRRPSQRDATRIEKAARAFLGAYLPYTHNHPGAITKLPSGTADARLIEHLLATPPHARSTDSPEIVGRIAIERITDREAVVVADIHGMAGGYAVALTLTRRAGRWTVTDTRPAG
jgi:hypothetical protein